jgi:hypothetical protein
MVAESHEDQINIATTNGVRWGACSALFAALSHFLELKAELELLGFGRNADLTDD